jgi:hypothetical protein
MLCQHILPSALQAHRLRASASSSRVRTVAAISRRIARVVLVDAV